MDQDDQPTNRPRSIRPVLQPGRYAFCPLPDGREIPPGTVGWFRETEGVTVILPLADAKAAGLSVGFEAAWITLTIHSALDGVGLTAAASAALAGAGISCNVVAAYHHDHLFVPADRGAEAVEALERVAGFEPGDVGP